MIVGHTCASTVTDVVNESCAEPKSFVTVTTAVALYVPGAVKTGAKVVPFAATTFAVGEMVHEYDQWSATVSSPAVFDATLKLHTPFVQEPVTFGSGGLSAFVVKLLEQGL